MIQNWDLIMEEGLIITVVGYVIVFFALVLLYLVFSNIARLVNFQARKKLMRQGKKISGESRDLTIAGDVSAAIALALYFYNELHDEEPNILTIKRVSKAYSPWSSKIEHMRQPTR